MANQAVDFSMLARAAGNKGMKFDVIKPWDNTKAATMEQIKAATTAIWMGFPVGMGAMWEKNQTTMQRILNLNFIATPTRDKMSDGHSVALVGFKFSNLFPGGGYFILRNSWDTTFGDAGYAYVSFDFVQKYANDLVYYHSF